MQAQCSAKAIELANAKGELEGWEQTCQLAPNSYCQALSFPSDDCLADGCETIEPPSDSTCSGQFCCGYVTYLFDANVAIDAANSAAALPGVEVVRRKVLNLVGEVQSPACWQTCMDSSSDNVAEGVSPSPDSGSNSVASPAASRASFMSALVGFVAVPILLWPGTGVV